jgi:phosphoethanolamine N-methyltransferase
MPAEIQAASPTEAEGAQPSPRADMKAYWDEHSATNTTVEAMMLDEGAKDIDKLERPEILGMLPDLTGLDMVELGAGIGRLTGDLAARAKSVIACDFIEASIKKNEEMHASLGNVEFLCADATKMDLPAGSLDVVFSNWLLMYFDDREVEELFAKALKWLKPGGFLFFRESCFHKSGNALRTDNPTVYRTPAQYHAMVTKQVDSARSESGMPSVFNLISQKTVTSYVEVKDNHNQIAWLYQKTSADLPAHQTRGMHLQSFLDTHRYTPEVIAAYERIYGAGFVSSGGRETTCELIESLALQPGEKVLDVGCGIGGGWQSLAYDYGVTVHGIDLSVNMVNSALERREVREGVKQLVSFEVADVMQRDFEPESFDVIYSRDSIMHVSLLARPLTAQTSGHGATYVRVSVPKDSAPDSVCQTHGRLCV